MSRLVGGRKTSIAGRRADTFHHLERERFFLVEGRHGLRKNLVDIGNLTAGCTRSNHDDDDNVENVNCTKKVGRMENKQAKEQSC
jgi:hypothetical protein